MSNPEGKKVERRRSDSHRYRTPPSPLPFQPSTTTTPVLSLLAFAPSLICLWSRASINRPFPSAPFRFRFVCLSQGIASTLLYCLVGLNDVTLRGFRSRPGGRKEEDKERTPLPPSPSHHHQLPRFPPLQTPRPLHQSNNQQTTKDPPFPLILLHQSVKLPLPRARARHEPERLEADLGDAAGDAEAVLSLGSVGGAAIGALGQGRALCGFEVIGVRVSWADG